MRKIIVTLSLLCSYVMVNAQDNWTLKKCIDYGLENNRNNTIFANEKIAADARAKEALADYLPRVALTSTLDNNLRLQETVIPAGIFGPNDIRVSLSKKYSSNATAQLDQVIYDQALLTGLKASKHNKQQAELNTVQSKENIVYNISIAYFQIFVYRQQLELLEFNKQTYLAQMQIYSLQVSKGITLQKDLDKVTVNYNNTITQIRVAESNLSLAQNQLKFEMGYPISTPISLASAKEILKKEWNVQRGTSVFSVASRVDYRLSELNIKLLEIQESRIKSEALPKLSGYFRYGGVGFGDDLKESYREFSPFSAVGVKLSIPVFDFFKRNAQFRQAKIERLNALEKLKISEGQYQVEYENSRTKLLQAQANVENDQRNMQLAESVMQVTNLQFQKGTTNLTDWLDTQYSLKEAQNSYVSSLYNFYIAKLDLEKAAGTLTIFYNSL